MANYFCYHFMTGEGRPPVCEIQRIKEALLGLISPPNGRLPDWGRLESDLWKEILYLDMGPDGWTSSGYFPSEVTTKFVNSLQEAKPEWIPQLEEWEYFCVLLVKLRETRGPTPYLRAAFIATEWPYAEEERAFARQAEGEDTPPTRRRTAQPRMWYRRDAQE